MKRDPTATLSHGFESRSGKNETQRRLGAAGSNPARGETEPNGASGPRVRIPLRAKRNPMAPQGRGFESRSGRNGTERRLRPRVRIPIGTKRSRNGTQRRLRAPGSNLDRDETEPNGASEPRVRIPIGEKWDPTVPQGRGFESRSRPFPQI